MNKLKEEDLDFARKIVDDIIDDTEKSEIENKIRISIEEYNGDIRRQFLVYLNTLFGNILLNELTFRNDFAEERALTARIVTKRLNDR